MTVLTVKTTGNNEQHREDNAAGKLSVDHKERYYCHVRHVMFSGLLFSLVFLCLGNVSTYLSFNGLSGINYQFSAYSANNRTTMYESDPSSSGLLLEERSLIHDSTIPWDPTVFREWLSYEKGSGRKPLAMLVLTDFGWNQKNQIEGLKVPRHIREREFMIGVINHPWFHPTFWEDVEEGRVRISENDTTRYYVFRDLPTYYDSHYPQYYGYNKNLELSTGRPEERREEWPEQSFFETKLFKQAKGRTRLIWWNGGGDGIAGGSIRVNGNWSKWPISYMPIGDQISRVDPQWDQGIIPPPPKPVKLTPGEEHDIQSCRAETKRKFFAVYIGNGRSGRNRAFHKKFGNARKSYFSLHDNQTVFSGDPASSNIRRSGLTNISYETVLRETIFGLAPRGDNKFSYRFTEILTAGAIPVVHADNWLWPFRPELIDWSECAIIMPEKDAGNVTLQLLRNMSLEERCKRRTRCLQIYKDYIETPQGIIRGIIEGLELVAKNGPKPLSGIKCSDYDYSKECNMKR